MCTFVTKPGMRVKVPTRSSKLYFGEIPVDVSKNGEITIPELPAGEYTISDDSRHQILAQATLLRPEHMLDIDEDPLMF